MPTCSHAPAHTHAHTHTHTAQHRGSISAEHGLGFKKAQFIYHSKSPEAVRMMREIKRVFDPKVHVHHNIIIDSLVPRLHSFFRLKVKPGNKVTILTPFQGVWGEVGAYGYVTMCK